MATKRLILVTTYNPRDISKWSGTLYFLFDAIATNPGSVKVEYIRGALGLLDFGARGVNKILRYFGISLDCRFSTAFAVISGAYLTVRLLFVRSGTLLGIASSNYLCYIRSNRDIIYVSDGTFRAICGLYPAFQKFPKWLQAQGDKNEQKTLSRARYIIHPSLWANESAKLHYGVPNYKLIEIPFGPNISGAWIERFYSQKSISRTEPIKMMFISADWKRKNGDKAIEITRSLINTGLDVRLTIIGDSPEHIKKLVFVDNLGFLRKSDQRQMEKICQAYREAHFLLLPTVADASPIVFAEAQAFGLPSISYDVGGTASAIVNGKTGLLFRIGTTTDEFVDAILHYVNNPQLYHNLSMNCRKRYQETANWSHWAKVILGLL